MGKSKIITYVIVAVLVLVGIYWVYQKFMQTPETPAGVTVVSGNNLNLKTDNNNNELIALLTDIDKIDLSRQEILSNKIFKSLKDFGRTIEDRVTGRTNPFSPLMDGSGISTNNTSVETPDIIDTVVDEDTLI